MPSTPRRSEMEANPPRSSTTLCCTLTVPYHMGLTHLCCRTDLMADPPQSFSLTIWYTQCECSAGPFGTTVAHTFSVRSESDNVTSAASPSSTAVTVFPPPDATFPMGFPASGSDPLATILPAALVPSIVIFVAAMSTILWRRRRGRARRQYASEMDLLGQLPPGVDLYVAHDDSAVGRMQHDDTPDIYSHPLQRMPSAGPSSLPMSPERLPSGKSRSHAVSQEPSSSSQLGRNPSLGGRSGIAGTEYPETLPPPYASEVGGEA